MPKSATRNAWRPSDASPLDDDASGILVVLAMSDWKREQIERDRRHLLRKTMDAAENRMRTRTAKEQLAEAIAAIRAPDDLPELDADDAALAGVMR